MIGKRYKFQLEDMVRDKLTMKNFMDFKEKQSFHYMNERNSAMPFTEKLATYKKANKSLIE